MMAKKLDSKELVTTEEISHSNMFQIEAIQRLLIEKGKFISELNFPIEKKDVK